MMNQPTSFGKYELLEKLATGGLADLYRAHTRLADGSDIAVVIKRLRPELVANPEFAAGFVDEARIAASLDHPNIARVYEWGRVEHSYFIAMEYIEGTNLGSLMQSLAEQRQRFPPTLSLYIMSEVLAGLSYAHSLNDPLGNQLGIVHGNICPPNIVISSQGLVKLVDFGLARAVFRRQKNISKQFSYQYTYFAPESMGESSVDARADIFSCGVVLYELLTGLKLHSAGQSGQKQTLIDALNARPPSGVFTDIPTELDSVVLRCLGENPLDRPPSADTLRAALKDFLQRWDHLANAETLATLLHDTFSGLSHHQGGFAFGEATSQWLAAGDQLQRMVPEASTANQEAMVPEAPVPEPTPPNATAALSAPEHEPEPVAIGPAALGQKFAGGETVMAVEAGGLGKRRQQTALLRLVGVLSALIVVVALIIFTLAKDTSDTSQTGAVSTSNRFAGAVELKVTPAGALISVDGDLIKPEGDPPRLLSLRPGAHRVKLMHPGYVPWEGDITLEADQPFIIERALDERTGKLTITSHPPGAVLKDNQRLLGKTPYTVENYVVNKRMKLTLDLKGYQTVRFSVEPSDWPEDPAAGLAIDKKLEKKIDKKPGRTRTTRRLR